MWNVAKSGKREQLIGGQRNEFRKLHGTTCQYFNGGSSGRNGDVCLNLEI